MNLKNKFCSLPFENFQINSDGRIFMCCPVWLDSDIGNLNTHSITEIFNSPMANEIRASILEGSFKYCNKKLCPSIQNNSLPLLKTYLKKSLCQEKKATFSNLFKLLGKKNKKNLKPVIFNLCYDESCNLECPSCRKNKIYYGNGENYISRLHLQEKVLNYIKEESDSEILLSITGSGDPFGSKIFRELLFNFNGRKYPKVKINLVTNGVLFTPLVWEKIKNIHQNLEHIIISFDAAKKETYAKTRKGGNWDVLLNNTKFLSKKRKEGIINSIRIDFVVQNTNFHEMVEFVKLGKNLEVDQVYFSLISDWGTWSALEFNDQAIWKQNHPNFLKFQEILENKVFDEPFVNLGNLTQFREKNLLHTELIKSEKGGLSSY